MKTQGMNRRCFALAALTVLRISVASGSDIIDAAKTGNLEKVTALLRDKPELVKDTDETGKTALHFAQNKQIAEVLLKSGAELELKAKKALLHSSVRSSISTLMSSNF